MFDGSYEITMEIVPNLLVNDHNDDIIISVELNRVGGAKSQVWTRGLDSQCMHVLPVVNISRLRD